jgi:hypothetical protein
MDDILLRTKVILLHETSDLMNSGTLSDRLQINRLTRQQIQCQALF